MDNISLYEPLAAAYVRGCSLWTGKLGLPDDWKKGSLAELEEAAIQNILKEEKSRT